MYKTAATLAWRSLAATTDVVEPNLDFYVLATGDLEIRNVAT